jgi:hypothetical protein
MEKALNYPDSDWSNSTPRFVFFTWAAQERISMISWITKLDKSRSGQGPSADIFKSGTHFLDYMELHGSVSSMLGGNFISGHWFKFLFIIDVGHDELQYYI